MDSFKMATKNKVRFYGIRGALTVEDLWDLPLKSESRRDSDEEVSLDYLYKSLRRDIRDSSEDSYFSEKNGKLELLELKLAVVQEVMDEKLADQQKAEEQAANAQKKQRLLQIIEQKEVESLKEDMSLEELKELAETL